MRSRAYQYPPAKFVFGEPAAAPAMGINSIVSAGSIISGSVLRNSVLSHDVLREQLRRRRLERRLLPRQHRSPLPHPPRHHRSRRPTSPTAPVIGYDSNEDKKHYFVTASGLTVVTRDYSALRKPSLPRIPPELRGRE